MRIATVVLPVPGLPVKHMCSDGACDCNPCSARNLSMSSSAAMSRMRLLTGARPINSASSLASTARAPDDSSIMPLAQMTPSA